MDASGSVQVVPPPMKSQSTVGAGDSMVGAMTLRLAENASLEDMVRFGVAAGSAATINRTRLCSRANTQKSMIISAGVDLPGPPRRRRESNISRMVYAGKAMHNGCRDEQ